MENAGVFGQDYGKQLNGELLVVNCPYKITLKDTYKSKRP